MSVDVDYIAGIYDRLMKMDVQLDADPIEFGPSRLNQKVSQVRTFLSQTEKTFMEVSHNLHKYKRDLLIAQTQYETDKNRLMAEDPHVRSGRSQGERESLASTRLVEVQTTINECTLSVHDLEDVMKVIKAKRTDLKDLQGRLRDQLKLCQEQIALGQRWGSKSDERVFNEISAGYQDEVESEVLIKAEPELRNETPVVRNETPVVRNITPSTESVVEDIFARTAKTAPSEMKAIQATDSEIDNFVSTPLTRISKEQVEDFDLDSLFDEFSS